MPRQYYLTSHIHACCTGRYCIFLDLNADRYLSIPKDAFLPLAARIHGWRITGSSLPQATETLSEEHSELIATLLRRNVLSIDPNHGRPAACAVAPVATADAQSMVDGHDVSRSVPRALRRALYALSYAQAQLRCQPMRRIISDILRRKSVHSATARPADLRTTLDLTASFARVRPYFPRSFLCLFDSLALVHFLACFGVYPDWVFGVREDPFFAHCWVQSGSLTLNDYHDRVAPYTPILVV